MKMMVVLTRDPNFIKCEIHSGDKSSARGMVPLIPLLGAGIAYKDTSLGSKSNFLTMLLIYMNKHKASKYFRDKIFYRNQIRKKLR